MSGREGSALFLAALLLGAAPSAHGWLGVAFAFLGALLMALALRWQSVRHRRDLPFEAARHTLLNAALRLYRARQEAHAPRIVDAGEMLDEAAAAFVRRLEERS